MPCPATRGIFSCAYPGPTIRWGGRGGHDHLFHDPYHWGVVVEAAVIGPALSPGGEPQWRYVTHTHAGSSFGPDRRVLWEFRYAEDEGFPRIFTWGLVRRSIKNCQKSWTVKSAILVEVYRAPSRDLSLDQELSVSEWRRLLGLEGSADPYAPTSWEHIKSGAATPYMN